MTITVYHIDINGSIINTTCPYTEKEKKLDKAITKSISQSINVNGDLLSGNEESYYHWLKKKNKRTYKKDSYKVLREFSQYRALYLQLKKVFTSGFFPSFVKLLLREILPSKSLLIFRTFGKDRKYILELLSQITDMKFVFHSPDELTLELYQQCIENDTHILVKDSYHQWNSNGKETCHGKIIRGYPDVIQYGFDDNHCMHAIGENITLFKVNTIQAALDEDYYLNLLSQKAELPSQETEELPSQEAELPSQEAELPSQEGEELPSQEADPFPPRDCDSPPPRDCDSPPPLDQE